eukprot:694416-Karenia_brevis.AAC.1
MLHPPARPLVLRLQSLPACPLELHLLPAPVLMDIDFLSLAEFRHLGFGAQPTLEPCQRSLDRWTTSLPISASTKEMRKWASENKSKGLRAHC